MRPDIIPGGIFPDYALPDHTETVRTLSQLQGDDPMILMLSRGHFCPKEHQQHLELAAFQSKVAVAYTQMVTISTDEHHVLQEFRASVGARWTFLSDPGRTIQRDLDIQEYTDPEHDPMIPHTLVLKPGLVVHSIYNGYWFWGRPSVYDLWRDLRAATSEIRPDWDLSKPGLREAWDSGDYSQFHGWDRQPIGGDGAVQPGVGDLAMSPIPLCSRNFPTASTITSAAALGVRAYPASVSAVTSSWTSSTPSAGGCARRA
jgi:peroxiredoxin